MLKNRNTLVKKVALVMLSVYSFAVFADIPLLQLTDAAVAAQKASITKDFIRRDYMAKASYTMLAAGSLWFAYKWGLFNKLLGKQENEFPGLPEDPSKLTHEQLLPIVSVLCTKINKIEAKHREEKTHWFVEGVKYVGLTGFSMIAGMVVQSKWQRLLNYAFAQPTFDWFYGSHTMLNRIDSLRYHVANAIDITGATPQASLDFHYDAIAPTLDTLYKNLQELVAFSEYYFEMQDQELVTQYNLESAPRYLFNTANNFFDALKTAVDAQDRVKALAVIDAFRAELSNYNKDCTSFENMALN